MKRRSKALWAVAALLLVNAALLVAQPALGVPGALAVPRALGNYFFGPKLVRADVLVKEGTTFELFRIDRGIVREVSDTALVLREQDGRIVRIPLSPTVSITRGARSVGLGALWRGVQVTVIRKADGPAIEVRVGT